MAATHSIKQIAELYGVGDKTVRRWIAEGRIPAVRLGPKLIRLDPAVVEKSLVGRVGGDAA